MRFLRITSLANYPKTYCQFRGVGSARIKQGSSNGEIERNGPQTQLREHARGATIDQTTANQERELREIAGRMGCEIVRVYKDHGISGTRGRDKRPAFDKLCRDAARREFDVVMAWSVDRLGRSLQDSRVPDDGRDLMAAAGCTRSPRRHDLLRLLPHPARKLHNAHDPRHHAHPRPSRRHDRCPGRL
jgi:hypothetical protein